ncbi:outer membrane protein [Methylocystis bryophila]|uniref:Porin n=1 Tax=Methylocystis bryophila TaxID=655015 RepID=A0A1W6MQQ0_9HYPH|nr:outer membrane beta-barrel protein [Methylocystis bryophila]ARN79923.1 porin [Methylocystis bryophila]BDV39821.1 outer-membrane immunogenic protein [Methylocystis bryophila]
MKKVAAISAIALAMGMGSALAADLPSRKAPVYVPPPPPLTWNGFYAGLNIGGAWNSNSPNNEVSAYWDPRLPFGSSFTAPGFGTTPNLFFLPNSGNNNGGNAGVVGGLQVGYNFQFNPSIVVGVETDFQGSSLSSNGGNNYQLFPSPYVAGLGTVPAGIGSPGVLVPVAAINGSNLALNYLGTVRGRAGWLFTPTLLVYGTAGFAYGGVQAWGQNNLRTGWTAGGGLEWMFAPNWSAKIEYLYADLSSGGQNGGSGWNWGYHFHPQLNIVRAGVNYHFNWAAPAPVLAKY